jgi:transcriptional regulator with XRE-family HTH domain
MDVNLKIAEKIKEMRIMHNYTSESIAKNLGISKSSYSQLENGHVEISVNRLVEVANIYNVPLATFVPEISSNVYNITNGDNSPINNNPINLTQVNNYSDKNVSETLKDISLILQNISERIKK